MSDLHPIVIEIHGPANTGKTSIGLVIANALQNLGVSVVQTNPDEDQLVLDQNLEAAEKIVTGLSDKVQVTITETQVHRTHRFNTQTMG